MRSILESAIANLLNGEEGKAEQLFHKFMVERARQIHESLRQGEDVTLREGWDDEITSEEYFAENDLDAVEDDMDVGDDTDAAADHLEDEMDNDTAAHADMEDESVDDDDMADDDMADDDMADDDMGGGDTESRLADMEDEIERLTREFEELMSKEGMSDEAEDADDDMDDDMDADEKSEDDADMADADDAGKKSKDADEDEDDFEDITESVLADLEKIEAAMKDDYEVGAGGPVSGNAKSPIPQRKTSDRDGAKPVVMKSARYDGYDREAAPPVKDMKARKNVRKKSTDGMSGVSKEGDKSASLNKDFAK
jgi:hypothetical protein